MTGPKLHPFSNALEQVGAGQSGFGYTGEQQDPLTQLIYLRARHYDPITGRFLTKDPFPGLPTQPQTQNPYIYAINNPVNITDPSGEYIESPLDVAFIIYDLLSLSYNSYHYWQASNPCQRDDYARQMQIDTAALALDVGFLFLPGTGGGLGYRLAYAGGGHLAFAGAVQTGRVVQAGAKGVQIGGQAMLFAKKNRFGWGESKFRGGKKGSRDKGLLGKPNEFKKWFHRKWKQPGAPDATYEEILDAYKEWIRLGRPKA